MYMFMYMCMCMKMDVSASVYAYAYTYLCMYVSTRLHADFQALRDMAYRVLSNSLFEFNKLGSIVRHLILQEKTDRISFMGVPPQRMR